MTTDARLIAATLIYLDLKKRESTPLGQDRHEAWLELADLESAAPEPGNPGELRVEPSEADFKMAWDVCFPQPADEFEYKWIQRVSAEAYRLAAERGKG